MYHPTRKKGKSPAARLAKLITPRNFQIAPDRITHNTAFVTPVVEHWLEREIAQWPQRQIHKCSKKKGKRRDAQLAKLITPGHFQIVKDQV